MAIPVPVTRTKIATVPWGIPITNEVNRLTDLTKPSTWLALTLLNGWLNFPGGQAIQYRKIGDIVYVRGQVKPGTIGAGTALFTLPVGFRPPTTIEVTLVHSDGGGNAAFYCDAASGNFGFNAAPTGTVTRISLLFNFSTTP